MTRLRLISRPGLFFSLLLGPAERFFLAKRMFHGALLGAGVLCLGTAIVNGLINLPADVVMASAISTGIFAGSYYLSRFRLIYRPMVWFASVWLPAFVGFVWIRNGGSAGATHAFLIILPLFFLPFAGARQRLVLTALYCALSAGLLTLEHLRPDLIVGYASDAERYYDMLFSTIATQAGIAFSVILLIQEYRRLTGQLEVLRDRSDQRFAEVADTIPAIIFELGSDLTIDFANLAGLTLTGFTDADLRSAAGLQKIIHPDDWPSVKRDLGALLDGASVPGGECRLLTGDGGVRTVLVRATARHNRDRIDGVRLYMVDITEKKRLEQQYLTAQKMESIGLLAGGIAHDFNNLLTGIQGFANLIKIENTSSRGSPKDAQLDENLRPILTAAQRAADLVKRLLVFSRQQPIQSAEFDLRECIAEAGAIVSRTLDKKISVVISMHPDPLPIRGDQSLLQSAIMNLCVNARDAMPRGGTLTMRCGHVASVKGLDSAPADGKAAGYAEITVIDTGVGMTPEVHQHLFEPFFTTKPPGKGTGLGLASVYGAIKGHHGLIEVISEAGRGTTFTLYLPLAPGKSPESKPAPARAPGPRTHERVVVVDDENMVRSFIQKVLSAEGHRVTAFADPADALDALRNPDHPFTMAIIDMVMPGMNGMELIKAMRATNRTLPVILISGYAGAGDTDAFILDPLVTKLAKPFDLNGLLNAMAKMAQA